MTTRRRAQPVRDEMAKADELAQLSGGERLAVLLYLLRDQTAAEVHQLVESTVWAEHQGHPW